MARPKKNTADYFPHLCNHGKKMAYIERRHGNDGYATWYKILEKLAQANEHYLYLSDEIEADFLADYCRIDLEKFTEIVSDLVKVGALDQLAWKYKIIYSSMLLESLCDLYVRRKDKPLTLLQIITQVAGVNVDNNVVNVYKNTHSIGKDRKVEKSIVLDTHKSISKCHMDFLIEIYGSITVAQTGEILNITKQIDDVERFGKTAAGLYKSAGAQFKPNPVTLCQKVFAEMQKPISKNATIF